MRVSGALLAVAVVVALSGCSSQEPNSPVDPEEVERDDYMVPLVMFVVAALVGAVVLVVAVKRSRRKDAPPPPGEKDGQAEVQGEPAATDAAPPKARRRP